MLEISMTVILVACIAAFAFMLYLDHKENMKRMDDFAPSEPADDFPSWTTKTIRTTYVIVHNLDGSEVTVKESSIDAIESKDGHAVMHFGSFSMATKETYEEIRDSMGLKPLEDEPAATEA